MYVRLCTPCTCVQKAPVGQVVVVVGQAKSTTKSTLWSAVVEDKAIDILL